MRENVGHWFADTGSLYRGTMRWHRLVNGLFSFTADAFPDDTWMVRFDMLRPKNGLEFVLNWSVHGRSVPMHEHWNTVVCLGLWGGYVEESKVYGDNGEGFLGLRRTQVRAPYLRRLPLHHRVKGRWLSIGVKWPFKCNPDRPGLFR